MERSLNEFGPLLSLGALSFFAWAFLELAGDVREGDTTGFDRALLLAMRDPDAAEAAMRAHLLAVQRRVTERLSPGLTGG